MSKGSTASAKTPTPLPSQSAWARGPPQNSNSSAPSTRSQSPAPSHVQSITASHSRRPSALGQGVPVKEGVSVPRNNVGSVRQGSSLNFGSIDDASAPVSSSPTATPVVRHESVKTFGSLPVTTATTSTIINGKTPASGPSAGSSKPSSRPSAMAPSISSSPSATASPSSTTSATTSSTAPASTPNSTPSTSLAATPSSSMPSTSTKSSFNVAKLFQGNPSASQPSSDATSPSTRPSNLPHQPPSAGQHAPQQPVQAPPMSAHPYPSYGQGMRPPRGASGPGSPAFSRAVPNGSGPQSRPMPGPGGPGGPPLPSSPRLAPPTHSHPPSSAGVPPQQLPMQPVHWSPYYYLEYQSPQWFYPMQAPHGMGHAPHAPAPTPQGPPHPSIPLSPRTQPPSLPPGTPTMAHGVPHSPHTPQPPPPHTHQPSASMSISPPPPTPSTSNAPGGRSLNTNATTFVPTAPRSHKITIKSEDGTEVKLESFKKPSPQPSTTPIPPPSPIATSRRTASVRIESEESKRKREEQARLEQEKKEADERAKKEEEERKQKEAEDAKRREEEEEERKRKEKEEEEERVRKAEEEKVRQEEERKRREEQERLEEVRRTEERLKAEKEQAEREQREREQKEQEERERAEREAEQQRQEEAEAEAQKQSDIVESPTQESLEVEDGEVLENGEEVSEPQVNGAGKSQKESLRIDTSEFARRRPGPLDINAAKKDSSAPPLSALLTARNIGRLDEIEYPDGIKSPKTELNENAKDGKFRYDRDFLMQFMAVCKEKPPNLPPLDILGIEPVDQTSFAMTRGGSARHRQSSGPMSAAGARSASIGLGIGPFKPGAPPAPFAMGQFGTPGNKLTSEERFMMSQGARSASVGGGPAALLNRPPLTRTPSQGGPGGHPMGGHRTRSKRGEKRTDLSKVGSVQQGPGFGPGAASSIPALEPVAPLEMSANRWVPSSAQRKGAIDADTPEVVDRKVKSLLNKLTMEKFDSISDQIIAWANKSENEKDGRTLIQVIRLVFEKATDEANWSEMYARLCRKMMETLSPKVQDDGIKSTDGKPITGGQLFRKYLLNRCQEDFERGWFAKEATARAAAAKASDDEAIKAANEKKGEESELYSDEYYAAQKAKRQGLGLIKFIGELFKLQMLTERIMHECVKKLLGNVENPEEEEIESLCQLLRTVGQLLDVPKARAHMDVYFQRMRELCKSLNVSPRMQFMLQDVIELRDRKWQPRNAVNAPTTLAAVHEAAAKEKAAQETQAFQRQFSMSRGGSKRGAERNAEPSPDGWAVAGGSQPRPPTKAGDLSHFGKISKAAPMVMGPSSVFAGKKDIKRESMTRTNSSSNMFLMLSQNPELTMEPKPSRAPSRKPSTDLDKPEPAPQRKKLQLLPRTIPAPGETSSPSSEEESEAAPAAQMSEKDAQKIDEDAKEFFAVRNLEEADAYFTTLTEEHRFRLVDKLVSSALESKEADARLVADFFSRPASQHECSPDAFEAGFMPMAELLEDIAIDAPKAFEYMAIMLKGAGMDKDEERMKRIAEKVTDSGDRLLQLVSS
ncbi:hypothetical protein F5J12DRAFT_82422 [Pisolithus orientalis]|uniref:uncharacterized protein n=1 Tax=Pisolithus orientalis TaxID=936130 RepID=UPI0022242A38|nr:uncharacterized protein F5J12DRAFT_82422 [Pisolithus orientalis]KAI6007609.1 hypothetical protein F5J12DRAFT_82422 [Pisolithus orientalis]